MKEEWRPRGRAQARSHYCALVLVVCSGLLPADAGGQGGSREGHAKAVFLRRVMTFVQWPPSGAGAGDAFLVCAAGSYQMGFALIQELRGVTIDGRRIDVQWVQKEAQAKSCSVLFLSGGQSKERAKLLELASGAHMLTVGDQKGFLEEGGILEFIQEGEAMQLGVNLPAAKSAGLKIDARVLSLARRVLREKGTAGS